MNLIVDSVTKTVSLFNPISLKAEKSYAPLSKIPAQNVTKVGLIVSHLPGGGVEVATPGLVKELSSKEKEVAQDLIRKFSGKTVYLIDDSAFFRSLPSSSFSYLIPESVKRVGRFGLTHESLANQAARALGKDLSELNLITLYLDKDSSVAAIKEGIAVEVSSGLNGLEGLAGANTPGSVDGQVILDLVEKQGLAKTKKLLSESSGLLGTYGLKGDLTNILSKPKLRSNPKFLLAMKIYLHQLQLILGAYAGLLGRVDGVVFGGVLGNKSELVRDVALAIPALKYSSVMNLEADPHRVAVELLHLQF